VKTRLPYAARTATGQVIHATLPSWWDGEATWTYSACGRRVKSMDLYWRVIANPYRCVRCHRRYPV
jgi:hypothetical protein